MNSVLINNWNRVVSHEDIIYVIGDFMMGGKTEFIDLIFRLHGNIKFILGSHDKVLQKLNLLELKKNLLYKDRLDRIDIFQDRIVEIYIQKQHITLCHYAMRVWPKSHYNSWLLYGHSHNRLPDWGKSYDVGVDSNNFTPISFNKIKSIMGKKDNNFNFINKRR